MFVSIIKDSVILFLLMYAILDLCQRFLHFLSKWCATEPPPWKLHFWDATKHPVCGLECSLRLIASKEKEPVLVIYNADETEKYEILIHICREFENIILITREECFKIIMDGTNPTASSVHNKEAVPSPDK